jgi:hypothetical protein
MDEFQNDQSKFHVQAYFTREDLNPYIETLKREDKLPNLTSEEALDVFSVTVIFLQTLLLCKTNDRIFLDLLEKPKHLMIEPTVKARNLNTFNVANLR